MRQHSDYVDAQMLRGKRDGPALLRALGWVETRAGRWIDPVTSRSYTAMEAWRVIGETVPKTTLRVLGAMR